MKKVFNLNTNWINSIKVNLSAVERRSATIVKRRTVKNEYQVAWLLKSISLLDLTTLEGSDTFGKVEEIQLRIIVRSFLMYAVVGNNRVLLVSIYSSYNF